MVPDIKLVRVTPDMARDLLTRNIKNRNVRPRAIPAWSEDMRRGRWLGINGETIKINVNGDLEDGQHRLRSVIEADVPVDLLIAYGVPVGAQKTIDTGMKRSFADTLRLQYGVTNGSTLAALVRRVCAWEHGARPGGQNPYHSMPQLEETFEKYPELEDHVRTAQRVYDGTFHAVRTSIIGLCVWLFNRIDEDDAEFFFDRWIDGRGLEDDNAIMALRNRMIRVATDPHKPQERALAATVIKAWNFYRDNTPVKVLMFRSGGQDPERFPEPH